MLVVDPKSGQKYNLHEDDHSLTDKELHVYHKKKNRRNNNKALAQQQREQKEGGGKKALQATATSSSTTTNNNARSTSNSLQYSTSTTSQQSSSSQPPTSIEEQTLNTFNSTIANDPNYHNEFGKYNDEEHTLETASALTEVSYYGRYKFGYKGGPFECIIPSSCKSLEHLIENNNDLVVGSGEKEKVEGRDDIESIERGRMKQLLLVNNNNDSKSPSGNNNNKKKGLKVDTTTGDTQKEGMLSPISHALQTFLSSPRDINISSFFPFNTANNHNGLQSPVEGSIREIKFRRLCLVVFPNEVQTSLGNTPGANDHYKNGTRQSVGLLGMKFTQNHHDFQAHVSYVQRGSKADRMGVRKGDIVSLSFLSSSFTSCVFVCAWNVS